MEQTFEELFESSQYNQNIKPGQIIEANVINITSDHAVLSAGLKSESFVNINPVSYTHLTLPTNREV